MNFWEDNYRVEEDGRVFSFYNNKYLKPWFHKDGYLRVKLNFDCKYKHMLVHRLVALTYIPKEDNQPQVDHIDRDKTNNHFTNLRWVTHLENQQNKQIGKSGERNIVIRKYDYKIQIKRSNNTYYKYLPKTFSMEQVIKQRDLMISMF